MQGQKPTPKRSSGPCQIGFRCTRLAYSALTCPAASFCRKSPHGHKVRGYRRGLRPQKPGCAFSDPQDTTQSQAGCEPADTPRALVQSASAEPRQTQCTTCMQPYEPSAPPVGTGRVVASAYALSSRRPHPPPLRSLSRIMFFPRTSVRGPVFLGAGRGLDGGATSNVRRHTRPRATLTPARPRARAPVSALTAYGPAGAPRLPRLCASERLRRRHGRATAGCPCRSCWPKRLRSPTRQPPGAARVHPPCPARPRLRPSHPSRFRPMSLVQCEG